MVGEQVRVRQVICIVILASLLSAPFFIHSHNGVSAAVPQAGRVETMDHVPTGTTGNFNDVTLQPSANVDLVVLDGRLWLMYRGNETREIMTYSPQWSGNGWNISFEAYAPREGSSYNAVGHHPGTYGLAAVLTDAGGRWLVGVQLRVGDAGQDGEGIYVSTGGSWARVASDILPAFPHTGGTSGYDPDLYRVGMSLLAERTVLVTVFHTKVGLVYSKTVALDADPEPKLHFFDEIGIWPLVTAAGNYGENGGWFVDDLTIRPAGQGWPEVSPNYEYVDRNDPVWLKISDEQGNSWPAARTSVSIGGKNATYSASADAWTAILPREVDWAKKTSYVVVADGTVIEGSLDVTTTFTEDGVRVAPWWNGWGWVTVFGLDDCVGPTTAEDFYRGFDHPYTAYINVLSGSSADLQGRRGEIALHYPHDYNTWMKKTWAESLSSIATAQKEFRQLYSYASLWDDPSYVGNGTTFLSLANPGNSATYQMMYAQYLSGLRIEGRGSNLFNGVPGNASLLGSFWVQDRYWSTTPGASWYPFEPEQLMDASRQWSVENLRVDLNATKALMSDWATQGMLLRIYGHPTMSLGDMRYANSSAVLRWLCNAKTDGTLENWKATDGEAASYIYSRWTTSISKNATESGSKSITFDVNRQDAKAAGYWSTPVTIDFDLSKYSVKEVQVIEGDKVYSSAPGGGLQDLGGSRVMSLGYDFRDGHLYVSHFFNSTAKIRLILSTPQILNEPLKVALTGQSYNWTAISSPPNLGNNTWTLQQDGTAFLWIAASNGSACVITGVPPAAGAYPLSLTVKDGDSEYTLNWTLMVGDSPDNVRPFTTMEPLPHRYWLNGPVRVHLNATDVWSGVAMTMVSIDSVPFSPYLGDIEVSGEGRHVISFYSIDTWGNVENITTVPFGIDSAAPVVGFDRHSGELLPRDRAMIGYSASDLVSGVGKLWISIDGGPAVMQDERGLIDLTGLTGRHTINITASDMAGNEASFVMDIKVSTTASMSDLESPPLFFAGAGLFVALLILAIRRLL